MDEKNEIPPGERPCSMKMRPIASFFMLKNQGKTSRNAVSSEDVSFVSNNNKNDSSSAPKHLDDSACEFENPNNLSSSKSNNSENTKNVKSVTYEDYLRSLTNNDKSEPIIVNGDDSHKDSSKDHDLKLPLSKPKGCASISNFFAPVSKKKEMAVKKNPKITVTAMVHESKNKDNSKVEKKMKKQKSAKKKLNGAVSQVDLLIECLDKMDVDVKDESFEEKEKSGKDNIAENANKKEDIDEKNTNSFKKENSLFVKHASRKDTNKDTIIKDKQLGETEVTKKSVKCHADQIAALDSIKINTSKKNHQATFSFGSGSMEIIKSPEIEKTKHDTSERSSHVKGNTIEKNKLPRKTKNKSKENKDQGNKCIISKANDIVNEKSPVSKSSNEDSKEPNKKKLLAAKKASKNKAAQLVAKAKNQQTLKSISPMANSPKTKRLRKSSSVTCLEEEENVKKLQTKPRKTKNGKKAMIDTRETKASQRKRSSTSMIEVSTDENSDSTPQLRRSSRACSKIAQSAISVCVSEEKSSKHTKAESSSACKEKKCPQSEENEKSEKKPKKTPLKANKDKKAGKTTSNPSGKLAPIFMKKAPVPSPEVVVIEEELTEEQHAKKQERRDFLMSGVPDSLRQQQHRETAIMLSKDTNLFPKISHVIQAQEDDIMWKLPGVKLQLRPVEKEVINLMEKTKHSDLHSVLLPRETPCQTNKSFNSTSSVNPIDSETVKLLLAEIATYNPGYPVRRVYKQLTQKKHKKEEENAQQAEEIHIAKADLPNPKKRKNEENEEGTKSKKRRRRTTNTDDWTVVVDVSEDEENSKQKSAVKRRPLRLSLRRRSSKNSQNTESKEQDGENSTKVEDKASDNKACKNDESENKQRKQDVNKEWQWTDSFAPTCSSEMLGNSRCVDKLKVWLREWKILTCRELRRQEKLRQQQEKKDKHQKDKMGEKQAPENNKEWWDEDDSDFAVDSASSASDMEEEDCNLSNTMLVTGPHGVGKTAMVYALAKELGYKVLEVNASSRRSGKQVLTELQEATQSHRVRHTGGSTASENKKTDASVTSSENIKKPPAAFANFFKPTAKNTDKSPQKAPPTPKGKKGSKAQEGCKTPRGKKAQKEVAITITPKGKGENKKHEKAKGKASPAKRGRKKLLDEPPVSNDCSAPSKSAKSSAVDKGIDQSNITLILFEEVDLVFEEDRGFWSAIQTFIHTTKRPIILTTSQPRFLNKFDPKSELKVEVINMRVPSLMNIASHLQLLCLSEGIRTSASDFLSAVELLDGDIRRCVLAVQLWLATKAVVNSSSEPIAYSNQVLVSKKNVNDSSGAVLKDEGFASQSSNLTSSSQLGSSAPVMDNDNAMMDGILTNNTSVLNSEDEFETIKTSARMRQRKRRSMRRQLLIEDETSCDSHPGSPQRMSVSSPGSESRIISTADESSQDSQGEGTIMNQLAASQKTSENLEKVELKDGQPAMYKGLFTSVAGLSQQCILEALDSGDLHSSHSILCNFNTLNLNLLYANHLHLLHLPTKVTAPSTYTQHLSHATDHPSSFRLTRIRTDLFDSDSDSNDAMMMDKENKKDIISTTNNSNETLKIKTEKKPVTETDRLVTESIYSLSQFYDDISFSDCYIRHHLTKNNTKCSSRNFSIHSGSISTGQLDSARSIDLICSTEDSAANMLELCSLRRCRRRIENVCERGGSMNGVMDALTVPVDSEHDRLHLHSQTELQKRLSSSHRRAAESVYDTLNNFSSHATSRKLTTMGDLWSSGDLGGSSGAPGMSVEKDALVLDYMPTLRTLSKVEQTRQAAKTKRRFLHYFDQIHLNLKQSTMDSLCSTFS